MVALPAASSHRTYPLVVYHTGYSQCHGCGNFFELDDLLRCSKCKRAYYCKKECQRHDWGKPGYHKKCCKEGLLDLAMGNIYRLPLEEKLRRLQGGGDIPNANLSQTINKVSCPDVTNLLKTAETELTALRNLCMVPVGEASRVRGHTQVQFVDYRYGLDVGVETLCLSINLWPGVFTVNSCSSLHEGAFIVSPDSKKFGNPSPYASFVSDDGQLLTKIQAVVERGALGIQFRTSLCRPSTDRIGRQEGFATIDCKIGSGKPMKCRAMCREIRWTHEPYDQLDKALGKVDEGRPPYSRMQNNLIGCLGLGLELLKANPSVTLSEIEKERLGLLLEGATELREQLIRRGNARFGLT